MFPLTLETTLNPFLTMTNQQAYNQWADSYDTVANKTRDVEAQALRTIFARIPMHDKDVLEIGCGTGKNTEWLLTKTRQITGADFSEEMLAKARTKITDSRATFQHLDLRQPWNIPDHSFDLITCSLVLEHIENIGFVFQEANRVLKPNGLFYFGELHPAKQYSGTKARFDTGEKGVFELECFVHHVSDFFLVARKASLECIDLQEWFDAGDHTTTPRILSMVFQKMDEL